MARGMGLPPLPHPHGGHPLAGHPGVNGAAHLTPHHVLSSSSGGGGVIGRPTSTPSTGTSAFNGKCASWPPKSGLASRPSHTQWLFPSSSSIIGGHVNHWRRRCSSQLYFLHSTGKKGRGMYFITSSPGFSL